jgi:hypothetical protein
VRPQSRFSPEAAVSWANGRTQRDFGSIDANAANTHADFTLTWFLDSDLFDSEHLGASEFMDANTADHVLSFLSKL